VPRVQFGLWLVPSVLIGNVDSLERYLIYRMGLLMVWNGARSMVWLMIVSIIECRVRASDGWHGTRCMDWDCGLFGKVPHVRIGIVVGLERCPECGLSLWLVHA
jgi:hypothetical protein